MNMRHHSNSFGFTIVELVMVIVIIGVLTVAVMPRLLSPQVFSVLSFYDQSLSMIRFGQKIAIAQRVHVQVRVESMNGLICLKYEEAASSFPCASQKNDVVNPADSKPFTLSAPRGVSLQLDSESAAAFDFNGLGRPSSQATLLIAGDGMERTITVEQETGYVH